MATAKVTVFIGSVSLPPYLVLVEQRSDWHHQFEITVSTEKASVLGGLTKVPESVVIENAIAYVGEIADITIERPSGTFHFIGYVTDVQLDQTYAGDSFIIFRGYSPTYLLEGQDSVGSFEEMTLKDIFEEVITGFPENLQREVEPKFDKPIPYITRYKETQYEFLNRLAATYGEWFYYDGQKLVFGELPPENPKVDLSFGSDSMLSFKYGIKLRPSSFKQQFYKYEDNATLENSVNGFSPGWLDTHSKLSLDTSKQLFSEEGVQPVIQEIKDKEHIKYLSEAKKASITGNTMIFNGHSSDPGITIGAEVTVESRDGFIGKYRVISATHTFGSNRDYNNRFRAIPITTQAPPMRKNIMLPLAESQAAVVTDNADPEKLGRVRVQFKWQEGMTPWIRVITNHAGEDRGEGVYGTYFIPEIGDEVFVEFQQDNPDRPYVVGSNYHGNIAPEFADSDNNLKAIKTKSGHTVLFNDEKGSESITISDKNGNLIMLDTKSKSITISAPTSILITSKDITIAASDNVNIMAETKNVIIGAKEDVSISGGKEANMLGEKGASLASGKDSGGGFKGSALSVDPKEASLVGKDTLTMGAGSEASIGSKKVQVIGSKETIVAGGVVKLN